MINKLTIESVQLIIKTSIMITHLSNTVKGSSLENQWITKEIFYRKVKLQFDR